MYMGIMDSFSFIRRIESLQRLRQLQNRQFLRPPSLQPELQPNPRPCRRPQYPHQFPRQRPHLVSLHRNRHVNLHINLKANLQAILQCNPPCSPLASLPLYQHRSLLAHLPVFRLHILPVSHIASPLAHLLRGLQLIRHVLWKLKCLLKYLTQLLVSTERHFCSIKRHL